MATTPTPPLKNASASQRANDAVSLATPQAGGSSVSIVFENASTASSATTGSASALPADPAGYIEVSIAGNLCKIPFYNA